MMNNFDWNLIKSFLAVIEHQTLMAAAKALKVSQPTLGRHITELETVTGLTLFDRGRSGMRPTDAALTLATRATDMQREADSFAMSVAAQDEKISGTVRITASQIIANYVLPEIITAFRKQEPDIQIEIVSSNQIQNLLARDADIAVRMTRPLQNDTIARKAADFGMGIFAHKAYLKTAPPLTDMSNLSAHTILGYDRDDLIINGMKQFGIECERSDFAIRTDDQVAYWHLLCAGAGIGFAPTYMGDNNPDLVRLLHSFEIPPLPIWLVSHHELRTNLRIRRTMDFIHEALSTMQLS